MSRYNPCHTHAHTYVDYDEKDIIDVTIKFCNYSQYFRYHTMNYSDASLYTVQHCICFKVSPKQTFTRFDQ